MSIVDRVALALGVSESMALIFLAITFGVPLIRLISLRADGRRTRRRLHDSHTDALDRSISRLDRHLDDMAGLPDRDPLKLRIKGQRDQLIAQRKEWRKKRD